MYKQIKNIKTGDYVVFAQTLVSSKFEKWKMKWMRTYDSFKTELKFDSLDNDLYEFHMTIF